MFEFVKLVCLVVAIVMVLPLLLVAVVVHAIYDALYGLWLTWRWLREVGRE